MTIRRILTLALLLGLLLGTLAACGGQNPPQDNEPSSVLPQTTAQIDGTSQTAIDNQTSLPEVLEPQPAVPQPGSRDSAIDTNGVIVAAVIPQDAILLPFHDGITSVAITNYQHSQHEVDWEAADTIQVRLREPAAGQYKDFTSYHIGNLPVELDNNLWLSTEGLWTLPDRTTTMFYVKFFQGGDESFTVVPMALPSDIVGPFSVKADFLEPNNFTLTSFAGNDQLSVIGQVCPEGCQIKVDTSLFARELFPDTTEDYFFFATGWGAQPQFAFPMGWRPQP